MLQADKSVDSLLLHFTVALNLWFRHSVVGVCFHRRVVFWMVFMVCGTNEDEGNTTFRWVVISLFYSLPGINGSEREFFLDFLDIIN